MKRKKLLPIDIEKIDALVPYRLNDEDMSKLKTTIAGFEFILIGGLLICPTCGQPQELQSQITLDNDIYFFLKFRCTDYEKPTALSAETTSPTEPTPSQ